MWVFGRVWSAFARKRKHPVVLRTTGREVSETERSEAVKPANRVALMQGLDSTFHFE
jgi:hypothetical protein